MFGACEVAHLMASFYTVQDEHNLQIATEGVVGSVWGTRTPRKTRFRSLAKLYRTGLTT